MDTIWVGNRMPYYRFSFPQAVDCLYQYALGSPDAATIIAHNEEEFAPRFKHYFLLDMIYCYHLWVRGDLTNV